MDVVGGIGRKAGVRQGFAIWFAILAVIGVMSLGPSPAQAGERVMVEAMEYPWSAIGRVNAGGRSFCTGFLISSRHVLTAGHCLYNGLAKRWWYPDEMHFVAGYQRDVPIIHSAVVAYQHAPQLVPGRTMGVGGISNDWAILTLAEPIGRQAGWLGLYPMNQAAFQRIRRGDGVVVQAGYRRDWAHAISVDLDCTVNGLFDGGRALLHTCSVQDGASGSPLILFMDGQARVIGMHVARGQNRQVQVNGAVSAPVFQSGIGPSYAVSAIRRAGAVWDEGQEPHGGSGADALPERTTDMLLTRLGYLRSGTDGRTGAIRAFERRHGLPVSGQPSIRVLAALLSASH